MEALALYGRLAGAQVRSQMQYRLSFALDTTATFLGTIVDFLAVWVFFGHTATLGGWTLPEVGLLYGFSSLSFGLADMLASGFDHAYFGPTMIRQGYFDQVLVRPVSPFLQVLASQVVPRRLGRFLQGALILAIALPLLGVDWTGPKLAFAGLVNAVGFSFSPNTGRLLENLVFLALRRQMRAVYYYASPTGLEVDFYLPDSRTLIQVAQNLEQPATREREVRALTAVMRSLELTHGLILTDHKAEPISVDGLTIEVRALAEWLLRP